MHSEFPSCWNLFWTFRFWIFRLAQSVFAQSFSFPVLFWNVFPCVFPVSLSSVHLSSCVSPVWPPLGFPLCLSGPQFRPVSFIFLLLRFFSCFTACEFKFSVLAKHLQKTVSVFDSMLPSFYLVVCLSVSSFRSSPVSTRDTTELHVYLCKF